MIHARIWVTHIRLMACSLANKTPYESRSARYISQYTKKFPSPGQLLFEISVLLSTSRRINKINDYQIDGVDVCVCVDGFCIYSYIAYIHVQ